MDQPTLREPRVVVGLDFGTTFSGFAFAHTSAPDDIYTQYDWPMYEQGGGKSYCKTLTGVYYERTSNGELVFRSWGWPAKVEYIAAMTAHFQAPKKANGENIPPVGEMLTKFKLQLASECDGPPSVENLPGNLKVDQVISDYLRGIGEFIMKELQGRYGNQITKDEVQWCLTVPSIWDDHAKQQMKLCMEKAGLVKGASDLHGSPYPVIVILEPEAASIYCHRSIKSDLCLQVGDKFLVVDLGGGTTDIVVQARANSTGALKVKEVSRSSGGLCGGTYVDKSFMEFLRRKIPILETFLEQHPEHEPKILGWWENAKSTFDGSSNFQVSCQISGNLARAWEEHEQQQNYDTYCITEFDEVELSCEDLKGIFDPVVDQNLALIEEKLVEHPDIKVIMAVGGFSGSRYMMSRIKETFGSRVSEIISPPHPGSAVCQGAVALALHADTVLSRVARKTYGINTMLKFEPGDREDCREVVNGAVKCKNRFDVFVQRGQHVDTDYSVSKTYVPTYPKQTSMSISLFSSDDDAPRYTEGEDVTKEGTFVVDMSEGAEELDRERQVRVTMYFGRSTVEMKAQGVNFGENKVYEMLPVRFDGDFE